MISEIFKDIFLARNLVIKKEIIPDIKITNKINKRIFQLKLPINSEIATAAPVLVRERVYRVKKEKPITRVFVAPKRKRKFFLFDLEIVFPNIAACPEPNPGRKLQRGAATVAPRRGFQNFILTFFIFCFGIFVLFFKLRISMELPNNPLNRGRIGWFIEGIFKTISPKLPVSKKTNTAENFFLSRRIKIRDTKINM